MANVVPIFGSPRPDLPTFPFAGQRPDPYLSLDWQAWVRAIRAAPDDDAPRLACADWLDEHGEESRAAFIRVEIEMYRRKVAFKTPPWVDPKDEATRRVPWREAINRRWVLAYGRLIKSQGFRPLEFVQHHSDRPIQTTRLLYGTTKRGFVEGVSSSAADWLTHGDVIYAREPVREVTLTTRPLIWAKKLPNGRYAGSFERTDQYFVDESEWALAERMVQERWPDVQFKMPPGERRRPSAQELLCYAALSGLIAEAERSLHR